MNSLHQTSGLAEQFVPETGYFFLGFLTHELQRRLAPRLDTADADSIRHLESAINRRREERRLAVRCVG